MASDHQIFLRDEQVLGLNASKRTIPEIQTILETIIPDNITILRINPAGAGYFISHANDLDLNYIFKADIIDKLKANHLKTNLAHRIQDLRKIVIPDIPDSIFAKSEVDLIAEINDKNAITTLTLNKFDAADKNKKYFFINLDSIAARNTVINSGKINISDIQFSAHKPISKPKNTQSGNLLPQQSYFTASSQNRGFALASSSRWGGPHRQNQQPQTDTSVPPPGWTTLRQGHQTPQSSPQLPPTKSSFHQGSSESDLLFNALVINQICKTLSCGIENPETYLALQNKALSQRGLPSFDIPKSELLKSKNLYYANTQSPSSPTSIPATNNPSSTIPNNPSSTIPTSNLSQPTPQPKSAETTSPLSHDTPPINKQLFSPQPPSSNKPPLTPKPLSDNSTTVTKKQSTDPSPSTKKLSSNPGNPSHQFNKFPHHLASIHQSSNYFVPHHIL